MSKRSLFVSFAESDGGHSYLAARAMLDPASIAHLIFKNTVAESLEAVATGQANYAVVPAFNSITQWEGSTLKALATGMYEIHAQVCMPTSYVLVAHKDYMTEFVSNYLAATNSNVAPTEEDAAKIYTRFLSRIFVSSQAEEQYRGRLLRPDMTHSTVELSRNPLRVLEEMTRSELMKAIANTSARAPVYNYHQNLPPNVSGGTVPYGGQIGATAYLQPSGAPAATHFQQPVLETLTAPAALVAAGLLDAPGDPEGWDQPGSLGEIVALLRKLLVLLNVYSFGAPDLPENKTQYLLVGRRGAGVPSKDAVRYPSTAANRMMTLVRPSLKRSSADQWLKPRNALAKKVKDFGYVLDRAPLMLTAGAQRAFLLEGGKPKDGIVGTSSSSLTGLFNWFTSAFEPAGEPTAKKSTKTLRKAIEKKPEKEQKDDTPAKYDVLYLGEYKSWCDEKLSGTACWCCDEAHADTQAIAATEDANSWLTMLGVLLGSLVALALVATTLYCSFAGSCNLSGGPEPYVPPVMDQRPPAQPHEIETPTQPPATKPEIIKPPVQTAPAEPKAQQPAAPERPLKSPYPGLDGTSAPAKPPAAPKPSTPTKPAQPSVYPIPNQSVPPRAVETKPVMFHVVFFEAKSNLTAQALNSLTSAASQSMQLNRPVNIRVEGLGHRERDGALWRRRLNAVKDELVRLGVPVDRIRNEGSGPFVVIIKPLGQPKAQKSAAVQPSTYDLDTVEDPLMGED